MLSTVCLLLVSDPVSDSMLQPLKHLLMSSDEEVLKAASLALSNFALYGSGESVLIGRSTRCATNILPCLGCVNVSINMVVWCKPLLWLIDCK